MKTSGYKLIFIGAGLIGGLLIILFAMQRFTMVTGSSSAIDYYQELANRCGSDDCCIRSAQTMADGAFRLASKNSCRLGYQATSLPCETSYRWCEPPTLKPSN